ncbi:MAG TPA: hypothetical protein DCX89_01520 [Saprospirales bacterium]|nr:hypothetical protein [Saprospirales bacterium]HAY70546.1 hypothetical protein [Saprospirales bacterium]HRQ28779.1 T9SS type A sorting domain-containing protein [Saprospiraceae bacterium]
MKKLLFISTLLWFSQILCSQNKQDYIWMFGYDEPYDNSIDGYILNFNNKPIEPKKYPVGTRMDSNNASICDKEGNLLFYTNGCHVMDRNGAVMENGDSLNYDEWIEVLWFDDCTYGYPGHQDIMILNDPGDENEYYIIHKPRKFNGYNTKDSLPLYYSKVDLNYNGGKGKLTSKNIPFFRGKNTMVAYLTAINHANGKDWWVVQPLTNDSVFTVFLINEEGIQKLPDQSTGIYFNRAKSSATGTAKFSPDGEKYTIYNYYDGLHIYDFDRSTGTFCNHKYIEIFENPNQEESRFSSVEWSPNSRFIYTASSKELHQIDLWEEDIQSNGIRLIDTYNGTVDPFRTTFFLMAQGPDCRIYMCSTSSTNTYHVINHPDSLGKACDFVQNGIRLPLSSYFGSMPNFPRFRVDDTEKCDPTIVSVFGQPVFYRRDLEIFPNPSSGLITVQKPEDDSGRIMVLDMQGTLLETQPVFREDDNTTMDLSHLPPGTYLIEYYPDHQKDRIFYSAKVVLAH